MSVGKNVEKKAIKSFKWSFISEVASKLATPIVTMILARLLTPDAFGVVATINMIVSLAEMFANAGFYKYIVQSQAESKEEKQDILNVTFWTNLVLSCALWLIIIVFRDQLSSAVGDAGLGDVLAIASVSLIFAAITSIGTAFLVRNFDFKRVFLLRLVKIAIPLLVTCPLAFYLRSYWALVIGTIGVNFFTALILIVFMKFKPQFNYNVKLLKKIIEFSSLAFMEQFLGWLNLYIGIFIVSTALSAYYVGIYKVSMGIVNQVIGLLINSIAPVLYTALSKVRDDKKTFNEIYLKFVTLISIFAIPIAVVALFRAELITELILGENWIEGADFIRIWAISRCLRGMYIAFCNEVFLAKGYPKFSVLCQFIELIILIPSLYIASKTGDFKSIYVTRSLVPFISGFIDLIMLRYIASVGVIKSILGPWRIMVYGAVYGCVLYLVAGSTIKELSSIIVGGAVYMAAIFANKNYRELLMGFVKK